MSSTSVNNLLEVITWQRSYWNSNHGRWVTSLRSYHYTTKIQTRDKTPQCNAC